MKPRVPITSRDFVYRSSHQTDVRQTWQQARERLELEKKVIPINQTKGKS